MVCGGASVGYGVLVDAAGMRQEACPISSENKLVVGGDPDLTNANLLLFSFGL
jgi:hypothetical protein